MFWKRQSCPCCVDLNLILVFETNIGLQGKKALGAAALLAKKNQNPQSQSLKTTKGT